MTLTDPVRSAAADRRDDCPAWCTEHTYDMISGEFISHTRALPTEAPESWVSVSEDYASNDRWPYIEVEVKGGNLWTAGDVDKLIQTLTDAKRMLTGSEARS